VFGNVPFQNYFPNEKIRKLIWLFHFEKQFERQVNDVGKFFSEKNIKIFIPIKDWKHCFREQIKTFFSKKISR
jgi:hypothetical protein